jgi:hypothetical protein
VNRALEGPLQLANSENQRCDAVMIANKVVEYFGWVLEGASDLYLWNPEDYYGKFDWPIGDNAHYELRIADEGTIDAPKFQAGDVLAEIES